MTPNERTHAERPSDEVLDLLHRARDLCLGVVKRSEHAQHNAANLHNHIDKYLRELDAAKPAQGAVWRCTQCGEMLDQLDAAWRWSGVSWQHHHDGAGHVDAREFTAQAPELRAVTDEIRSDLGGYLVTAAMHRPGYDDDTESIAGVPAAQPADEIADLTKRLAAAQRPFDPDVAEVIRKGWDTLFDDAQPAQDAGEPVGEVFGPKATSTMVALNKPLPPGTKLYLHPASAASEADAHIEDDRFAMMMFWYALNDANEACRSAFQVVERCANGDINANWTALRDRLSQSLKQQHDAMYVNGKLALPLLEESDRELTEHDHARIEEALGKFRSATLAAQQRKGG